VVLQDLPGLGVNTEDTGKAQRLTTIVAENHVLTRGKQEATNIPIRVWYVWLRDWSARACFIHDPSAVTNTVRANAEIEAWDQISGNGNG